MKQLTPTEQDAVNLLISVLKQHDESSPIKAKELLAELNNQFYIKTYFVDSLLRKFCNYLRSNAVLPVISGSKGYFITENPQIILNQIKSLINRADSIDNCAEGLKVLYNKYK